MQQLMCSEVGLECLDLKCCKGLSINLCPCPLPLPSGLWRQLYDIFKAAGETGYQRG
jgi:hypothetical protein